MRGRPSRVAPARRRVRDGTSRRTTRSRRTEEILCMYRLGVVTLDFPQGCLVASTINTLSRLAHPSTSHVKPLVAPRHVARAQAPTGSETTRERVAHAGLCQLEPLVANRHARVDGRTDGRRRRRRRAGDVEDPRADAARAVPAVGRRASRLRVALERVGDHRAAVVRAVFGDGQDRAVAGEHHVSPEPFAAGPVQVNLRRHIPVRVLGVPIEHPDVSIVAVFGAHRESASVSGQRERRAEFVADADADEWTVPDDVPRGRAALPPEHGDGAVRSFGH